LLLFLNKSKYKRGHDLYHMTKKQTSRN